MSADPVDAHFAKGCQKLFQFSDRRAKMILVLMRHPGNPFGFEVASVVTRISNQKPLSHQDLFLFCEIIISVVWHQFEPWQQFEPLYDHPLATDELQKLRK
jgi:hypothetical protein